jgi:mono/diheme cytochrome c family protein
VLYYLNDSNATTPFEGSMKSWRCLSNFKSTVRFSVPALILFSLAGCTAERRRSDAELGLNPQQAAGRRIYENRCARCHEAYSSRGKKGPSLKGVYKQQYLSKSGLPANDEQVGDIIHDGRNDMPGYADVLTQQQTQDLLAYLHTL